MALAHAMWIHGHSLQVEYPERLSKVERRGFSVRLTSPSAGQPNWLHFAIPTPVIVNDNRLRVGSVLVRFKCGIASVKAVHVYDGETKIAAKDNLNLSPKQWHMERIQVPGTPQVHLGLGISVLVDFGPDDRWVEFSSAGCDFLL
jgi:hypothetical protein